MLLQKLCEYADRLDLPPPMYQKTRIKWFLDIKRDGRPVGFVPLAGEDDTKRSQRGKEMLAPHRWKSIWCCQTPARNLHP